MEGEENKMTKFFMWTIMLGCNESNIIFQQGRRGAARAAYAQFCHATVRRMTKKFVQHCQSIYVYNLCTHSLPYLEDYQLHGDKTTANNPEKNRYIGHHWWWALTNKQCAKTRALQLAWREGEGTLRSSQRPLGPRSAPPAPRDWRR